MSFENNLKNSVEVELKRECEKVVEECISEATKKMQKRAAEVVSSVALKIMQYASFSRVGDDIVITVKMVGGK